MSFATLGLLLNSVLLFPASMHGAPNRTFQQILREGDIPGASISRVANGKIVGSTYLGRRAAMDLRPDAPKVDAETVFEGASLGKSIVALATLRLSERGQIQLDASADAILPYTALADPRKQRITVRMLLSHSSGLAFGQPRLESAPGSRFSYSTEGFRYLQKIVEKVSGESLESWAQREVFRPLRMTRTSFVYTDRFAANRATGRNWLLVGQESMKNSAGTGAFDLITTSSDLARLWAAVLNGKVVSPPTVRQMFTPQIKITGEFYDASIPKKSKAELACGLGILLQRQGNQWIGFQWGDNGGSTSFLLVNRPSRAALIYLTNAEDGNHSAEAIAARAGMKDLGASWVGYDQVETDYRKGWKLITRTLSRDPQEGKALFDKLLVTNRPLGLRLARNLGYFNRFRGRVAASEPYFRLASTVETKDADLLVDWADALVEAGNIEEAADAQARAVRLDPSQAGSLTLGAWVTKAKEDLAKPVSADPALVAKVVGKFGKYQISSDPDGSLILVSGERRRTLLPTPSSDFLSQDLFCRIGFSDGKVQLTIAGRQPQILERQY